MNNQYWIERLQAVTIDEWRDDNIDTLGWVRYNQSTYDDIEEARADIRIRGDKRLSYRITDGGRVWPA